MSKRYYTKEEYDRICAAVPIVWNVMGVDCDERIPNSHAVEACLDANRIASFAHDAATDRLVTRIAKAGGFTTLVRRVSRDVKLT